MKGKRKIEGKEWEVCVWVGGGVRGVVAAEIASGRKGYFSDTK